VPDSNPKVELGAVDRLMLMEAARILAAHGLTELADKVLAVTGQKTEWRLTSD
jgi:hypothetical protein